MKYEVYMESPLMEELLAAAEARIAVVHVAHMHAQRSYGRGSDITVAAGRKVAAVRTALTELRDAVRRAEPERASGIFENATLQVGDHLSLVYGKRPSPRVKRSNAHRKTAA